MKWPRRLSATFRQCSPSTWATTPHMLRWTSSLGLLSASAWSEFSNLSMFYSRQTSACLHVCLQWAGAALMVGGSVLQHGGCRKVVSSVVVPSQSWMGADQVWAKVFSRLQQSSSLENTSDHYKMLMLLHFVCICRILFSQLSIQSDAEFDSISLISVAFFFFYILQIFSCWTLCLEEALNQLYI